MATYFYSKQLTPGLPFLLSDLQARRLTFHDGMNFRLKGQIFTPTEGDVIICWGRQVPEIPKVRVINGTTEVARDWQLGKKMFTGKSIILMPQLYTYTSRAAYLADLLEFHTQGSCNSGVIPIESVPDWGYYPLNYSSLSRYHIVGDVIIGSERLLNGAKTWELYKMPTGKNAERLVAQVKNLGLSFACIELFRYGSNNERVAFKNITTAPELNDYLARAYSKAFSAIINNAVPEIIQQDGLDLNMEVE